MVELCLEGGGDVDLGQDAEALCREGVAGAGDGGGEVGIQVAFPGLSLPL
jgi:hypothetical protein